MAELHVECRVARVEACRDAVVDLWYCPVEGVVCDAEFVGVAEGEHRAEAECGRRVCFNEGVADEQAVFVGDEDLFFGEDHASDSVGGAGHVFAVEFAYVFVAVWAHDSSAVAVKREVEGDAVLVDCFVE